MFCLQIHARAECKMNEKFCICKKFVDVYVKFVNVKNCICICKIIKMLNSHWYQSASANLKKLVKNV